MSPCHTMAADSRRILPQVTGCHQRSSPREVPDSAIPWPTFFGALQAPSREPKRPPAGCFCSVNTSWNIFSFLVQWSRWYLESNFIRNGGIVYDYQWISVNYSLIFYDPCNGFSSSLGSCSVHCAISAATADAAVVAAAARQSQNQNKAPCLEAKGSCKVAAIEDLYHLYLR